LFISVIGGSLQEGYGWTAGRVARNEMIAEWAGIRWTGDMGVTTFPTNVAAVGSISTGANNAYTGGSQGRGFGNNVRTTIAGRGECRVGTRVSHGPSIG
jgi:hypothetical protein